MNPKILIAQGGGPTAVVNASLAALVRASGDRLAPVGVRYGLAGLLKDEPFPLDNLGAERLDALAASPGAALGSSRYALTGDDLAKLVEALRRHDIHHVAYIGGNGTMRTLRDLARVAGEAGHELAVAGIPKTIDNDLAGTDFAPGYPSCARAFAQAAIDLAMDIRSLPTPVSILEVMGRRAGWLTAATVLGRRHPNDPPHRAYVPEQPPTVDSFLADVESIYKRHGWVVVAVAEGLDEVLGIDHHAPAGEAHGGRMVGDVAAHLAGLVTARLGLRARSEKPGLTARAAAAHASRYDRQAAALAGRYAVQQLLAGETGFMVALRTSRSLHAELTPLDEVAGRERLLPPDFLDDSGQPGPRFVAYAEPLLGGPLQHYDRLI